MTDLTRQFQEYTDTTAAYLSGEDVVPGDCWRAALASLLEVPISDVPHFVHLYPTENSEWWFKSVDWVQQQRPGWTLAVWEWNVGEEWSPVYSAEEKSRAPVSRVILTGPSPRGSWHHSVLVDATTGELAHDPFPGGTGVNEGAGDLVALVRNEWLT